ncbi:hypothetical protein EJB05_28952, partial [Eragrostis curvula]
NTLKGSKFQDICGNLPQNVDCNRLQQFFSNHGKVADSLDGRPLQVKLAN